MIKNRLLTKALEYDKAKVNMQKAKSAFKSEADSFFAEHPDITVVETDKGYCNDNGAGVAFFTPGVNVKVARIQKKTVTFNVKKLKKKLDKEMFEGIVDKVYTINDMPGLVSYLKTCNVDPKIFRTFVDVSSSVNEKKLNQMSELGEISIKDIDGCFSLKTSEPYYTVSVKQSD